MADPDPLPDVVPTRTPTLAAPRAARRPTVLQRRAGEPGEERSDDWYWLRDRDDPEVLAYLEAENAHTEAGLAHLGPLREELFEETKRRVRETDATAPVRKGDWEYFTRTVAGLQYPLHCRRPAGTPPGKAGLPDPEAVPNAVTGSAAGETVLLDENALAALHPYFALRGFSISPDQSLLAYATDLSGAERSTLRFRELTTGTDLPDEVPDTYYGLAWANDNRTVYFVRPDEAMRPWQVWRHTLGTPTHDDVLVFQEDDERFFVHAFRTRTGRYVLIETASKLTSEVWVADADDPGAPSWLVAPRREGVEYHVEHHVDPAHGDRCFVLTNADGAVNFKVLVGSLEVTTNGPRIGELTEVIATHDDTRIQALDAFARHLVVSERAAGLEQLRVIALDTEPVGRGSVLAMPETVFSTWVGTNPEFESDTLRCGYTSLVTPVTDLDVDLDTGISTVVKRDTVTGYDAADYETFRVWATAPDGVAVPISVVRRRGVGTDGPAPLLLYGYGSYEISIDPTFATSRVSLLERGVVYAIAHVRGGGELGRRWYDDGKLTRKRNTFTDFIACAEHLVHLGITSPDRLVARGGSAGGLLMGAVANMAPQLFRAIVAEVPFVDCLTTMLDASLPLTVTEWEEWGDPVRDDEVYSYLESYSPYDNVTAQAYPAMLITAGLNDPRVQYWEPTKWAARLRASTTGTAPIYLRTELDAGHHGPSGRYSSWRETAFVSAFVLDQLGCNQ